MSNGAPGSFPDDSSLRYVVATAVHPPSKSISTASLDGEAPMDVGTEEFYLFFHVSFRPQSLRVHIPLCKLAHTQTKCPLSSPKVKHYLQFPCTSCYLFFRDDFRLDLIFLTSQTTPVNIEYQHLIRNNNDINRALLLHDHWRGRYMSVIANNLAGLCYSSVNLLHEHMARPHTHNSTVFPSTTLPRP